MLNQPRRHQHLFDMKPVEELAHIAEQQCTAGHTNLTSCACACACISCACISSALASCMDWSAASGDTTDAALCLSRAVPVPNCTCTGTNLSSANTTIDGNIPLELWVQDASRLQPSHSAAQWLVPRLPPAEPRAGLHSGVAWFPFSSRSWHAGYNTRCEEEAVLVADNGYLSKSESRNMSSTESGANRCCRHTGGGRLVRLRRSDADRVPVLSCEWGKE